MLPVKYQSKHLEHLDNKYQGFLGQSTFKKQIPALQLEKSKTRVVKTLPRTEETKL